MQHWWRGGDQSRRREMRCDADMWMKSKKVGENEKDERKERRGLTLMHGQEKKCSVARMQNAPSDVEFGMSRCVA